MKKFIITLLFAISFLIAPFVFAEEPINLYFFYGQGCPHCAKEEVFLDKLKASYGNINVYSYEVWYNQENADLLAKVAKELNIQSSGVPVLVIGEEAVIGYGGDETTGRRIKRIIDDRSATGCVDRVAPILGIEVKEVCAHGCDQSDQECLHNCGCQADAPKEEEEKSFDIPFFGEVNSGDISLPIFTFLVAALDGFNPCAMWVLIFLISLLLGMADRRKMWILGSAFILTSGLVYFLFLSAWLNLFLFIGFIKWIRLGVAMVALWSGYYHLREYFRNKKGTCQVIGEEKRKTTFAKIQSVIRKDNFLLAFGGIIMLAAAVNLVELVCSAGLPAVYTHVLSLADLPAWQYYAYLVFYIIIFMLDDMLIFVLAMATLRLKGISSKYTRWSNLIGGLAMLIVGLLLAFKPEWIMF